MSLHALTDAGDVQRAFRQVKRTLESGAKRLGRSIGFQGGSYAADVFWRPELGFWCLLEQNVTEDRFWCPFGLQNPEERQALPITCEVNPPKSGTDLHTAGMFVRAPGGAIFLAHSGRIGGGRKGVGQKGFLDLFAGRDGMRDVSLPDGRLRRMILLGRVERRDSLLRGVDHFVREVARVKAILASPQGHQRKGVLEQNHGFAPEFRGLKRAYRVSELIEADARHGIVIDALRAALEKRGLRCQNDRYRDLFVSAQTGSMSHLFEAKTTLDTGHLYEAVGQLMLHGAAQQTPLKRILVLPGTPSERTQDALDKLGITVIRYRWRAGAPQLFDLSHLLSQELADERPRRSMPTDAESVAGRRRVRRRAARAGRPSPAA